MPTFLLRPPTPWCAFLLGLLSACSSSGGGGFGAAAATPDASTAGADRDGGGGTTLVGSDAALFGDAKPRDATASTGDADLNACATDSQQAKPLPLSLSIMLDTSGSMSAMVSATDSKYDAVKKALTSFVGDPASAGMGVGLQFFPLPKPGVPATCTSSAQCGAGAPCFLKACTNRLTIEPCDTDAECGFFSNCRPIGTCQNNPDYICRESGFGQNCGNDPSGNPLGTCTQLTTSECLNRDSCDAADYEIPVAPIGLLPGVSGAIVSALGSKTPSGFTPTAGALAGAIQSAKAHATTHPGETVVAVLATDGLPTRCDTSISAIAQLAANGLAGTPSIKTFVIGVFAQSEQAEAQPNLDQIAQAGGTTNAILVTANANASQAFLQALNSIRAASLPCDYALPPVEAGTPDYNKVNVQYTPGGGAAVTVGYATNAAGCDPTQGGWYYDVDPNTAPPTKVILCPATCAKVKADLNAKVDVVQGCKTVVQPPPR